MVFFTNSGAEAIECAIKTARKYHWAKGQPERIDIIGFDGSFHGRTMGAIAAGGNPSYLEGFGPPLPGFVHLRPATWTPSKAADRPDHGRRHPDRARAGRGRRAALTRRVHAGPARSSATRTACC